MGGATCKSSTVPGKMTTNPVSYDLPAGGYEFETDVERGDPLAPLRGVLLGILLGGALWINAWLLLRTIF